MINQAEHFLNDWGDTYERTQGEQSQPDFSTVETKLSPEKKIPHYVFEDGSVILEYHSENNQVIWNYCDGVHELDIECNVAYVLDGVTYEVFDVCAKRYNHAFDIAFEIETIASCDTDDDYPPANVVRKALQDKLDGLSDEDLMVCVGVPFDTYENE